MKKPIFLWAMLAACAGDPVVDDSAWIEGTVVDQNGAPLKDARVSTMPVTETVLTGDDGAFKIAEGVRISLTYQVFAVGEGFNQKTATVMVKQGDNRVDFALDPVLACAANTARCVPNATNAPTRAIERCDATGTNFTRERCPVEQICDDSAGMNSAMCSQTSTLSVTNTSRGSGLIVSAPSGISCGGGQDSCDYVYTLGKVVTLSASPFATSTFLGFSGACTTTESQCAITMDADKAVTGSFEQTGFLLTVNRTGRGRVTSDPGGINCGSACAAPFEEGTMIELTANADNGAAFGGWTGACTGTQLTCRVTINADTEVGARFMTPQNALVISKEGTGAGTVSSMPDGLDCGPTCSASFDTGTIVTLHAESGAGATFTGWSGDVCTGTADCTITVDQDRAVTATFDGISHTVSVTKSGGGQGTITSLPAGINCGATCSASFGEGQQLQLTAAPINGGIFTGWSGACATAMSNPTCMLDVTGPLTASANFEPFFFGTFAPDPSCTLLIHFDAPNPFAQQCGGGSPAALVGTYAVIMSRTAQLGNAPNAGGANEEGHIELSKVGPAPATATIEMTVRKNGAAFDARTFGVLYSNRDALDPATGGVRLFVRDDGRFVAETRRPSGTTTFAESAANAIQNNTWYHLAATLNATTGISLFIDGVEVATQPGPLGWSASSSTAWAGAEREGAAGSIYRFNGAIDEIRVSDVLRY